MPFPLTRRRPFVKRVLTAAAVGVISLTPADCSQLQHVSSPTVVSAAETTNITTQSSYIWQDVNELSKNRHFELDTADWLDWGTPATSERSTTRKVNGEYSARIDDPAPDDQAGIYQHVAKNKDKSYGFSFDYYLEDSMYVDTLRVRVRNGDDSGDLFSQDYTDTGSWQRVQIDNITETIQAGGGYIIFENASDFFEIEFFLDRVSFWEHVEVRQVQGLTVDDASHSQTASEPSIDVTVSLTGDASVITQAASSPSMVAGEVLSVDNTSHAQAVSSPSIAIKYALVSSDGLITQDASVSSVIHKVTLTVNSCLHTQAVSSPTVSAEYILPVAESAITQTASSPLMTGTLLISSADGVITQSASESSLIGAVSATTDDGLITQDASEPSIDQSTGITPDESTIEQDSSSPSVIGTAFVIPDESTITQGATEPQAGTIGLVINGCLNEQFATSPTVTTRASGAGDYIAIVKDYNYVSKSIQYAYISKDIDYSYRS